MKFNFTVDIEECDNICSLQGEIINQAAGIIISEILGYSRYTKEGLYEQLEDHVIKKLENILDTDFKKTVSEKVTENLANKFEKTSQYKLLKADKEIIPDSLIKTGLKDLVAEIVKSEMKKVFSGK